MPKTKQIAATVVAVSLIGSLAIASGVQAAGLSLGALVASQCNTCHGTDGEGAQSVPRLAGLDADEIFESMKAFASGEDAASIMDRVAKGYSDEQLHAVANYYSEQ